MAEGSSSSEPLALVNGRILRHRERQERVVIGAAATALLVEGGRVTAIGDDRGVSRESGGRGEVVDLHGAVVAPGFVDAHIHAFDCAIASLKVSLLPPSVDSLTVLKRRLAERAASMPTDVWVVGEGYDDMRLAERRHPTRKDLDEAVPDRPAIVTRVCGHMSVANTRALELAAVHRGTADPPGGAIVRDAAGSPTGLLLEEAQDLVLRWVPAADASQIARALRRTARILIAHGVTTICEALLGAFHPQESDIWSQVLSEGWGGPGVLFLADPRMGERGWSPELQVIGTKLFADGVVTGRTAALSRPFEGGGETGILIHEPDALAELVEASATRGLPVGIHAMGDRGIATAVGAIERLGNRAAAATRATRGNGRPLGRHRIEHCSLPSPASLRKMQALGIVPVPQPVFLFAEGEAYKAQLGIERCARAYPLRTMIRQGLRPALSSDAPATSSEDAINPWLGIRAAATRRTWAGSQLGSAEAISVAEAIACYTVNGAAALSLEHRTGSLDIGKDADLIVLPDDPLSVAPEELEALRPKLVLLKGRIVYSSDS